ncbi:MAG: hypothetical protein M1832_003894 [Thelocarpon impressellum]|nr:MAG: hypothetical protein M1832_003894 [Thelocarpon impressellum]
MTTPLDVSIPDLDDADRSAWQSARRTDRSSDAATGASAAGVRALSTQLVSFYFRAPAKAFFRTRIDYMALARAINPRVQANERWSWRLSTPSLLAHAVKARGWGFISNQVLPPLIANIGVGAVLYTSYLQFLGALYEPSAHSTKRVYPPPPLQATLLAGFAAGTVQSVVAAPVDALQVRFKVSEMLEGRYKNMWQYGRHKLREIGPRGVFAGWGLSWAKESLGCAVFFATFEFVKQQAFISFISHHYDRRQRTLPAKDERVIIRPHFTLEPIFLLAAGISASLAQQAIQHPLTQLQRLHHTHLETLDHTAPPHSRAPSTSTAPPRSSAPKAYARAYASTLMQARLRARAMGSWRTWLYRGFWGTALRQVPSTSAGLIVFELVRRRYGQDHWGADGSREVRVAREGYDILLS